MLQLVGHGFADWDTHVLLICFNQCETCPCSVVHGLAVLGRDVPILEATCHMADVTGDSREHLKFGPHG